jgi:hypothetical protein
VTAKRDAQIAQAQRPVTVSDPTRSLPRTGPLPSFISTGTRQSTLSDEEEEELDDAYNLSTTDEDSDREGVHKRSKGKRRKSNLKRNSSSSPHRAKVAFTPEVGRIGEEDSGSGDDRRRVESSRAQSANDETRDSAGRRFTIFSDPSEQVTLLDVHRTRMRSAAHEKRVHDLCERMSVLEGDKRYLLPDYYFVCLNEETGGPGSRANIPRPVTPESDRDSGFVYLPDSLTFKPIDMSFRRRTRTAGARLDVS